MKRTLAYYAVALKDDLEEYCKDVLKGHGITRSQLYYLLHIVQNPGCSPGQAAQALHADAGHTTRTIDKLVAAGCVRRHRDKEDRRTVALYSTEKGQALYDRVKSLFCAWDEERMQTLTQEEQEVLMRVLEKVMQTHPGFEPISIE